jgi:hypothetical protein
VADAVIEAGDVIQPCHYSHHIYSSGDQDVLEMRLGLTEVTRMS